MDYQTYKAFTEQRPTPASFNVFADLVDATREHLNTDEAGALEKMAAWYDDGPEFRIDTPATLANFAASHVYPCVVMVLAGRAAE